MELARVLACAADLRVTGEQRPDEALRLVDESLALLAAPSGAIPTLIADIRFSALFTKVQCMFALGQHLEAGPILTALEKDAGLRSD